MRPRTQRRLSLSLLTAGGLLLMAEAAVSVFARRTLLAWEAPVPVTRTGAPYLPGNPYLLWEMVPGTRTEMGATVSINSLGFRGPELTVPKPPGTRRVVVLGDSTVYGHGVEDAETFTSQLDADLGSSVQVINLGTPGYSTAQSINLMTMRGWALEPDLVVIASLWSDNNFDSFVDKTLLSERRDVGRARFPAAAQALQASALYRWLDWHLRLARRADEVETVGWMLGRTPTGGHRRVSVNDYAANLMALTDEAEARGAEVVFLAFANAVDLGAETDGAIAWLLYREVMQTVAKHTGAPFVTVQPAFATSGLDHEDLFLDEMHPSPAGHQLIAKVLGETLTPWAGGAAIGVASDPTPLPTWDDPFARGEGPPPDLPTAAVVTLSGSIINAPSGIPVQIDLIDLSDDRSTATNPMVGSARFDHVDTFEMPAPRSGEFGIRIYLDKEADGPSSTDDLFEFLDIPIAATGQSLRGLVIDLETGELSWVKPGTTSPAPRATPGD